MDQLKTQAGVVLGVDTHLDVHVAVVVDALGRVLATESIAPCEAGYKHLFEWASSFGSLVQAGVEGTGTYGAGLATYLAEAGVEVIEVNRPNRLRRRLRGKSDPTDAENAARAVLSGEANAQPKTQAGIVEAMRAVSVARRSAVKARTQAVNQLRSLLVSAPDSIRARLLKPKPAACIKACLDLDSQGDSLRHQTLLLTLRLLARRWRALTDELRALDSELKRLIKQAAPSLMTRFGVGPQTAATLLVTAGDNPGRLRNDAALAALCGVSPLEASSGKVVRHRLNRGGDRRANNALWTITLVRMRSEPRTKAYVARRTQEGRSTKEIQRCLKRYLVRELYPLIVADLRSFNATA